MKKMFFKLSGFAAVVALSLTGCVSDDDTSLPKHTPILLGEDFNVAAVDEGTDLNLTGWTNFNEQGDLKWTNGFYSDNGYAEFNPYQSGDATNVGWLITPAINMDEHEGEKLFFQVNESYVSSTSGNSFQALVSTNFDGTNVTAATWIPLELPDPIIADYDHNFVNFNETIDLSAYTGNIYIAFKVKGSGTNTSLDGGYEVDNVRVYY